MFFDLLLDLLYDLLCNLLCNMLFDSLCNLSFDTIAMPTVFLSVAFIGSRRLCLRLSSDARVQSVWKGFLCTLHSGIVPLSAAPPVRRIEAYFLCKGLRIKKCLRHFINLFPSGEGISYIVKNKKTTETHPLSYKPNEGQPFQACPMSLIATRIKLWRGTPLSWCRF